MILALLVITPAIVACKDSSNDQNYGADDVETEYSGEEEADADPLIPVINEYIADLAADYNFKGTTFSWIGPAGWQAPAADEETGNTTDDAMYFRQRELEEKFGLTWNNIRARASGAGDTTSPTVDMIRQDVMAGTGAYDAAYAANMHTQQLLINNTLMNLTDFTTMDLEREWWPQDLYESFSIGGELYFLTGPIVTKFYQDAMCFVFNKQVALDYNISGLYDLARNREWTFDKMLEIASVIPPNNNGSGAYRYAGIDGVTVAIAHGYTLTDFDDNGNPFIPESPSAAFVDLADKYSRIFSDDAITVNTKGRFTGNYENFEEKYGYGSNWDLFTDDKILFLMLDSAGVAFLRTLEVNFGVLPVPMGYDTQDEYISYSASSSNNVFVPKTSKNPQMVDVILEAMAALGYKYFKPTYYDNMLKSRSVKDYESKEMLDIIFSTKKYEIANIIDKGANLNGDGELVTFIEGIIEETSDGFVSRYFIKSKIINANIKQILANIEADVTD